MTKGGVSLFTKSAALEFSRKGYRIRVNSIHPGVIQTEMGEQTFVSRARNIGTDDVDAARQIALSTHLIGRLGTPTDIAKGILFLSSPVMHGMNRHYYRRISGDAGNQSRNLDPCCSSTFSPG
jgi:3(or 17)beta-hydroxysteroid dehydrogenase